MYHYLCLWTCVYLYQGLEPRSSWLMTLDTVQSIPENWKCQCLVSIHPAIDSLCMAHSGDASMAGETITASCNYLPV